MLLIARQVTDVRFEHVKAHEGNPVNDLMAVLPREPREVSLPRSLSTSSLLDCHDSVTWE